MKDSLCQLRLINGKIPESRSGWRFACYSTRDFKNIEKERKIALLIDCDNVSSKALDGVITELAKYGIVNIQKAYGN